MQIVATFDPSVTTPNTFSVPQSSASGKMVVWNESNISIQLNFQNGDTTYVPAWTARMFCGNYGGSTVTWSQHSTLASSGPPLSQVVVETFASNESIPGTFPATLSRQSNIGNVVNTVGGTATAVQNDGNIAPTTIVESTVSGDAGSSVTLTNSGVLTLGSAARSGTIKFFDNFGAAQNILTLDGANGTILQAAGHLVALSVTDQNGQVIAQFLLGTGISILSGKLNFVQGSIARIDGQHYTPSDTLIHTYAHNLGAVPDLVIPTFNATSSGFTASVKNFTASNFDMIASNSGHLIDILLIKF